MQDFLIILAGLGAGALMLFLPSKAHASIPPDTTITRARGVINAMDHDTLARTIWGEARGEGQKGMHAVANVIMNRYRIAQSNPAKARQFGRTITAICKKPKQFSAWNIGDPNYLKVKTVTSKDTSFRIAQYIAEDALLGKLPDITNGADHYHTASVNPSWSRGAQVAAVIGNHRFFKLG